MDTSGLKKPTQGGRKLGAVGDEHEEETLEFMPVTASGDDALFGLHSSAPLIPLRYYRYPNNYFVGVILGFNQSMAYDHAVKLVEAALVSGTLKLEGATSHGANQKHIDANVEHINGLLNGIAKNLMNPPTA